MENQKRLVLFFITSLLSISTFAGGGWPKKKNAYYLKLASFLISANENFNQLGDKNELTTQGIFNLNLYGEYGITDRLTAVAYIPFLTRSFENKLIENGLETSPGSDQNTLGDIEIGVKYGLFKNELLSWTVGLTLGLPTGESDSGNQLGDPLPTGDGEFNQLFRTDLGISIYNSEEISLYGNVYTGVNVRSKDFSEEFRGGIEVGAGLLSNKLWLVAKLDTILSFNNGDRNFDSGSASIFANNVEVTNISPEVAYYFTKKIGISASASFPLSGKFVYADPSYSAGVFLDIK